MLAAALESEVNAYTAESAHERDENGHRLVVRNGYHHPRKVTTAVGAVEGRTPRVNDKRVDEFTGERKRFSSANLPPWCREPPKIAEVLPPGSRAAGLAMVFKLVEPAQARWRAVNGSHLVPLVRAGARFERGRLVERPEAVGA